MADLVTGLSLQGDLVHQLKENGAKESELSRAIAELKARKRTLEAKVKVSHLLVNLSPSRSPVPLSVCVIEYLLFV